MATRAFTERTCQTRQRVLTVPFKRKSVYVTVLCELRGAEERGDPERLLCGLHGLTAVSQEEALGEGQFEVAGGVLQIRVFFALSKTSTRGRGGRDCMRIVKHNFHP